MSANGGDRMYMSADSWRTSATAVVEDNSLGHRFAERRQKRIGLLRDFMQQAPCPKCAEFQAQRLEDKARYFKETEHLRRGITKLLEAMSASMPSHIVRGLKEQLNLGVRYLTTAGPEEAHGGFEIPEEHHTPDLVKQLKARIIELEEEVERLQEKLNAALELLSANGISAPGGRGAPRGKPKANEAQTDITGAAPPGLSAIGSAGAPVFPPGSKEAKEHEAQQERDRKARQAKEAEEAKAKGGSMGPGGGGGGPDHAAELSALRKENALLKLKLEAAEKALKELDALRAAKAALEALLAQRSKQLEKVTGALPPAGAAAHEEADEQEAAKAASKAAADARAALQNSGGRSGLGSSAGKGRKNKLAQSGSGRGRRGRTGSQSDDEDGDKPQMVDACVGNGPGPGMEDEPLKVIGHEIVAKEEINKNPNVFEKTLKPTPELGLGNPARLRPATSSPSLEGAKTWSDFGKFKRYTTGTPMASAEPYLLQVWEHRPQGHAAPSKRELIRLGAICPQESKARMLMPSEPKDLELSASPTTLGPGSFPTVGPGNFALGQTMPAKLPSQARVLAPLLPEDLLSP